MKTQAWGWLVAGVLAAGLNASYHDGGLQWAHRIAGQIENRANVVLALAQGRTDEAIAEASWTRNSNESIDLNLDSDLAEAQEKFERSQVDLDQLQALSDRQMARMEAHRDRMEARLARVHIPATAFTAVSIPSVHVPVCPRIRVSVPRVTVPATPTVRIELSRNGPV